MKRLLKSLIAISVLIQVGCGQNTDSEEGTFVINIQWPTQSEELFRTQAIPINTSELKVEMSGSGLNSPMIKMIKREGSKSEKVLIPQLPIGRKKIIAKALDSSGKTLALDSTQILIESGKTTQAVLELQPVKEKTKEAPLVNSLNELSRALTPSLSPKENTVNDPPNKPLVSIETTNTQPENKTETTTLSPPKTNPQSKTQLLPLSGGSGLPSSSGGSGGGGTSSSSGGSSSSGSSSGGGGAPPPPPNTAPSITGLNASSTLIQTTANSTINITANDAEETLVDSSYNWSCDGGCGSFDRTDSPTVIWTAPATGGTYTLRVAVNDGVNPPVEQTLDITVNNPPTISTLVADPSPITGVSHPSEIVVSASDTEETLVDSSYNWSCDGGCGSFDRTDSPTVIWTAPATAGTYTLRVAVDDGVNLPIEQTVDVTVNDGTANINFSGGAQ